MPSTQENILISEKEKQIIFALLYFDVFNYPLKFEDLQYFCKTNNSSELGHFISNLIFQGLILKKEDYYFVKEIKTENITKREAGNKLASEIIQTAQRWSKKMYQFPFVNSINISGSLSKNFYDKNSDIDYFIIAKSNRVWICRSFLILYWKILPKEKKKYWCTNYFIDEDVTTLDEKNYFTAVELAYLLPTVNAIATENFYQHNLWLKQFLPTKSINKKFELNLSERFIKRSLEFLLNGIIGDKLENFLFKKTLKRWQKSFPNLSTEDFELQFRSRKDVSKRHTKGYQNKVLKMFEEKIVTYSNKYNIDLKMPVFTNSSSN